MNFDYKPELVAPAGDWSALKSAAENGADAVYFGIKSLNMRDFSSNFEILELTKIVSYLHKNKIKAYLALNVIVFDQEIDKVKKILIAAKSAGVDAVILWDTAVLELAREIGLTIHISTQAGVSNSLAMENYARMGARRVVLARECDLEAIKEIIRQNKTLCRVETFIHGAMCVSISGRCFLSSYSFAKSANRGQCIQPCRREYLIRDIQKKCEYVAGRDYLLSAKDLCSIDFIDQLIAAGIYAFKIEGRSRSPEYTAVVVSVYRQAIDAFYEGKLNELFKQKLKQRLAGVYNRGFSAGFYFGQPQKALSRQLEQLNEKIFIAEVTKFFKKINVAEIIMRKNELKIGNEILITGKHTPARFFIVEHLEIDHVRILSIKAGQKAGIKLTFEVKPGDKVFIWRKKFIPSKE